MIRHYFRDISPQTLSYLFLEICDAAGLGVIFLIAVYFASTLGFKPVQIGLLLSCYSCGTMLSGAFSGFLADHIAPQWISFVGLLLKASVLICLVFLRSFEALAISMLLFGMSAYAFKTANSITALRYARKEVNTRLKVLNLIYVSSNIGLTCPAIVLSIFPALGFVAVFKIFSGILLLASVLLLYLKFTHGRADLNCSFVEEQALVSELGDRNPQEVTKPSWKIVAISFVCLFLTGLSLSQLSSTFTIFVHELFPLSSIQVISLLFVVGNSIVIFFGPILVQLLRNFNKIIVMGLGSFLFSFGFVLFNVNHSFAWVVLACVIRTLGEIMFASFSQILSYHYAREQHKGLAFGLYQNVYSVSLVVGGALGGYIYGLVGPSTFWFISGGVGSLCLAICLCAKNLERKAMM